MGWASNQLAELAGNAVLFTEGGVSSLTDVVVNFLSGGLTGQQQLELGNDLLVHQLLGGGGHFGGNALGRSLDHGDAAGSGGQVVGVTALFQDQSVTAGLANGIQVQLVHAGGDALAGAEVIQEQAHVLQVLIGGVLVPHGNQAVHGAVAGLCTAVHGGNGQEGVVHGQGVLNGGAVVGFQGSVVLLEVVLEQRHSLAEDHGVAGLAHDHTLAGFHAVVGHITGLGHFLNGGEHGEHVLGGHGVLQIVGEGVAQTCACAEDIEHIGGGDAGVCEDEAVAAVLGALLDDIQELLIGPAFLLNLGNVNAQLFHHGLVGADGLDGQVQGQAVGGALQGQVLQSVLVVVGQTVGGHVLSNVVNGMITNPPPKVLALSLKVEKNNFLYFCKLFTSKNAVLSMFINIIPLDF